MQAACLSGRLDVGRREAQGTSTQMIDRTFGHHAEDAVARELERQMLADPQTGSQSQPAKADAGLEPGISSFWMICPAPPSP